MPPSSQDYYICPGCGAEVLVGASGCLHCSPRARIKAGAPREKRPLDHVDEDFDYEAFLRAEFGHSVKPGGISWIWWCTGVVLFVSLLWGLLGGR